MAGGGRIARLAGRQDVGEAGRNALELRKKDASWRLLSPGGVWFVKALRLTSFAQGKRAIGFEPTTSSLGSWHSTTELRPRGRRSGRLAIPETSIGGRDGQAFLAAK